MEEMANSTGATEAAFNTMEEGFQPVIDKLRPGLEEIASLAPGPGFGVTAKVGEDLDHRHVVPAVLMQ